MKPLLIICIAALAATALLPDDAFARSGVRRPRVVIVAPRRFYYDTEPGAIYGFAPGNYIPGPNGMLYGPYRTRRPFVSYGPDGPDIWDWWHE